MLFSLSPRERAGVRGKAATHYFKAAYDFEPANSRFGRQQQPNTNTNNSMKTMIRLMTCAVVAAMSTEAATAALNIPSDGSDGALVITSNTVIDLSQAVTGNWDADNTANAGKGIYDPNKWAVVFKYSSVTINANCTNTFKNHPNRAPVVWLVSGDVTINGTVSLDGQTAGYNAPNLAEPGPGGFRAGMGNYGPGAGRSAGFGPGGGSTTGPNNYGAGGSYGSQGAGGPVPYGNPSLIPLIGGSGGGGWKDDARGGGAGGGAILIAASGNISVAGTVRANGGGSAGGTGGGSGGGIRLVAGSLSGNGVVQCLGGAGSSVNPGGAGRIRIERSTSTYNGAISPDPSVVVLSDGATPQIWLPTNGPTVRIISIGGNPTPADPLAEFGAFGADVVLPQVTNTTVVVETTNVEQASAVTVRATPRSNGDFTQATAAVTQVVSTDPLVLHWTANVPVKNGYAAIQVKVVRP
jgi:hypothetical protein